MAGTVVCSRPGLNGYEWHGHHRKQGFPVNRRELRQVSKPGRQNQRACVLSPGLLIALYFLEGLLKNWRTAPPSGQDGEADIQGRRTN